MVLRRVALKTRRDEAVEQASAATWTAMLEGAGYGCLEAERIIRDEAKFVGNLYLAPGRDRITKTNGCIANKITARKGVGRAKSWQLLEAYKLKESPGRPSENGGGSPTISQRQIAKSHGISKDREKAAVRAANIPAAP